MKENLSTVSEAKLLERFAALVRIDSQTIAEMVAHIAEIDRRKLWAKHAHPSMFAFCVERFHMSEAVAFKRIRAGRAASRFPVILGMLERGELHLSGIHRLAAHLTENNHQRVLARAKYKTTRQIEKLIAEIAPQPDTPSRMRKLPRSTKSNVTPLSPKRYKIEVTVTERAHQQLEQLQELMSHQIPNGDPALIIERALGELLRAVRKRKAAHTDRPAAPRKRKMGSRTVPAAVQREVWKRDAGQCRYVDDHGNRCKSRRCLEYHHISPFARGGSHSAANIELRCRAHNQYEAELAYGRRFMEHKRSA